MNYLPKEFMDAVGRLEREGLPKGVDGFDMARYEYTKHPCGTVRCLIGNLFLIDLDLVRFTPFFGFAIWNYLFASQWVHVDNTLEGAIARARWVNRHGLPDNWENQIIGKAPLPYLQTDKTKFMEETRKIINEGVLKEAT
jgi:hypothetical protein